MGFDCIDPLRGFDCIDPLRGFDCIDPLRGFGCVEPLRGNGFEYTPLSTTKNKTWKGNITKLCFGQDTDH